MLIYPLTQQFPLLRIYAKDPYAETKYCILAIYRVFQKERRKHPPTTDKNGSCWEWGKQEGKRKTSLNVPFFFKLILTL